MQQRVTRTRPCSEWEREQRAHRIWGITRGTHDADHCGVLGNVVTGPLEERGDEEGRRRQIGPSDMGDEGSAPLQSATS